LKAAIFLMIIAAFMIVAATSTTAYAQQPQNMTTTTNNNTNSSSMELQGPLAPDHIANMSAQDPEFAAFQEVLDMCQGYSLPLEEMHRNNATMTYDQCVRTMQQSVDKWCSLAAYQKDKCETASLQFGTFTAFNEIQDILNAPTP
jgi:hypothetical protein